jgi:hypothetical protein
MITMSSNRWRVLPTTRGSGKCRRWLLRDRTGVVAAMRSSGRRAKVRRIVGLFT